MGKFKKGDKLKCVRGWSQGVQAGHEYTVAYVSEVAETLRVDGVSGFWDTDRFVPATRGPIRAVTRKEIVPGRYGVVNVGGAASIIEFGSPVEAEHKVHVSIGGFGMVMQTPYYNASELRAAAATLAEIADALDEVA